MDPLEGEEVIDAASLVVLPGIVDMHVHFNEPGRTHWEGWGPGSLAAAAGGVTTEVEMPLNAVPPVTTTEALKLKLEVAQAQSVVDFALWGGLIPSNVSELESLSSAGVVGFKAFLSDSAVPEFPAVDDGILLEGLDKIRQLGKFLAVHAENDAIIRYRTQRLRHEGRKDRRAWGEARPPVAELEAIKRVLHLANEVACPVHVVHMSLPEGADLIREARRFQHVTVETCPHYLVLAEEDFTRLGPVAKCAPPIRDINRREALWNSLLRGDIDCVASDHSPCSPEEKARGEDDIFEAWGGITGIQTLLPLMLTEGVHRRGLPLERLVRMTSEAPARITGLWPKKGGLVVGADADFVLVDIEREWKLEADWLKSRHRQSPYLGRRMMGYIVKVLRRGETIMEEGESVRKAGGKWLGRFGRGG